MSTWSNNPNIDDFYAQWEKSTRMWGRQCGKTAAQIEFAREYFTDWRGDDLSLQRLADEYVRITEEFDEARGGDEIWRPGGSMAHKRQECAVNAQYQWYRLWTEAQRKGYTNAQWRDAVHAAERRWDEEYGKHDSTR